MARYYFYPPLTDQSEFNQLLGRLAWYFPPERLDEAIFFADHAAGNISPDNFACPPDLNPEIVSRVKHIQDKVKLLCASDLKIKPPYDAVFLWRENPDELNALKKITRRKPIWRIDRAVTRMEGAFWAEALHALDTDRELVMQEARRRLQQCYDEGKHKRRASIITSGPSTDSYREYDFSNDRVIVCNSVVADTDLLTCLRPEILCFADPIFHFGPSLYTREFYQKLRQALALLNPWVIVPWKYRRLLLDHVPEVEPRLIAFPINEEEFFNFDLLKNPEPKATDNILTYLLIPVAASLCKEIRLLGCDGRPLRESQYFWSFNTRTQLSPGLMKNIQDAHPGFFKLDYNDYYKGHCQTLERQVLQLECEGHTIESLAPSHIPVLQRRSPPPTLGAIRDILRKSDSPLLISLNPNLRNHRGDRLTFDCALQKYLKKAGHSLISLANRDYEPAADPEWPVLPFFSSPPEPFNRTAPHNQDYGEWENSFSREIGNLIDALTSQPNRKVVISSYRTDARMVQGIISALALHEVKNICWVLNFSGTDAHAPSVRRSEDEQLKLVEFCADHQAKLAKIFRVIVTFDSSAVSEAFAEVLLDALPGTETSTATLAEKDELAQVFKQRFRRPIPEKRSRRNHWFNFLHRIRIGVGKNSNVQTEGQ